jgi:ribosomal protein S18 acetylase RimI-like enzyme
MQAFHPASKVVMSSFEVRPATARDAKEVAQIHVAAWQSAYQGIMPAEDLAALSVAKREAIWKEAIEYAEPQLLVATEAGNIVGFVGFDRSRDKGTPATTGEIWALYAAPDHWGKDLGLALWDAALEACIEEGFTSLTLWVLLRNERALRFFEAAGFKRDMPSIKTVQMGTVRLEEIRLKRPIA